MFANTREAASFPSLVHRLRDPVNSGIPPNLITVSQEGCKGQLATYRLVVGVDEYDFIILVYAILVDPVRVQHTQVTTTTADALFCNAP